VVERDPSTKGDDPSQLFRCSDSRQDRDDAPLGEPSDDDALFRDLGVLDFLGNELFERSDRFHETRFIVDPLRVGGKVVQGRDIEPSIPSDVQVSTYA
jgi:hypothetical protein